jgi:pyrroline-5-carboxylate reductase
MTHIVFIGGGNMASAIIGGLINEGQPVDTLRVVEPSESQRRQLHQDLGVTSQDAADASLAAAELVVWAVKPQMFGAAAGPCAAHVRAALQLSVMAGIRTQAIEEAVGTRRIVRAMPNTPALIGKGISGLYAGPEVTPAERALVQRVLAPTGATLWVNTEQDLDAVTALSGSGPAYVFYFVEAMIEAAQEMGLPAEQGREFALATFAGATALAQASPDPPSVLRDRVTSKGGTTQAALQSLESNAVKRGFVAAIKAARQRARELGDQFGGTASP